MTNHRPKNTTQGTTKSINKHSPEPTLGHVGDAAQSLAQPLAQPVSASTHPTEPMGLKRRHFMGTALALDAAALLAACGGGGGGGGSGSTNTSGSSSGSGSGSSSGSSSSSSSASSSASGSSSSSASSSGSGSGSATPAPTNWVVSTLAGMGSSTPFVNGTGGTATFNNPTGIAVDTSGYLYVADKNNQTIRKISTAGEVSTLAGTGVAGAFNGSGSQASFNHPSGVALDNFGNIFVAETSNHLIRKITSTGEVSTWAGIGGTSGAVDGVGITAKFSAPTGVAVDSDRNIYVADQSNHIIRKISPANVVSTLAGVMGMAGYADGTGTAARFNNPCSVAVDYNGNVYVADRFNHMIRKISPAGMVSVLAGGGGPGTMDGTGGAAKFSIPSGVATDLNGNVYVADFNSHLIRKISPDGVVVTLAGTAETSGSDNGTGTLAKFNNPYGVAVDTSGNVYVADSLNFRIRKITPIY